MEVRILGPTEVVDGSASLPLPRGRARSLLGLLALSAGEVISTDRLIDELWGESPPPTVHTALQGLVYKLRGCLEPERASGERPAILLTRAPGYLLDVSPGQIDSSRFRRMVAEASAAAPEDAAELLRGALDLWRGPALVDFRYDPFAQSEIAELEELRLTALERRIEADLALGRHREVVGELQRLIVEHRLREGVHGLLMLALYRSGRQAEALRVYAGLRSTLRDQMGLDPGTSLQQLEDRILRQDPMLDLEVATPLEPASDEAGWIPEERRFVTVLAVDISTETDRGDTPDAEVLRKVFQGFFRRAGAVVTGHGGRIERTVGDTVVGIFGLPTAREDDGLRAVQAAVDLRHLMAALNSELSGSGSLRLTARVGVDTGEVIVGEDAVSPSGNPIRRATQLCRAAKQGEILIGEATRLLVGKVVLSHPRKFSIDDGHDRAAWRVLDLMSRVSPLPLTLGEPLVGREAELDQLRVAYERVVTEGRPLRITMLGEPGVGKSRLARQLVSMMESEARVLIGHCLAYGEGHTFSPLGEVVKAAAGAIETEALLRLLGDEENAHEIARHVMVVTGSTEWEGSPAALFPMLRRFFQVLTDDRPVVLILEDLHWARPTLLDLVEYLTESVEAPLFLVCLARPELLEEREWVEGDRSFSLLLGPLEAEESRRLAADRLAGRMVPGEVLIRVLETAQGNPLFIEQLVATIGEDGDFSIPASVQALLAARIDRLGPAERDVIRFASVLGHRFPEEALVSLLPEPARPHLPRHLRTLERKDLMFREATEKGECGFRHVLIRQAAYRSMTMRTRAELHELAADWLEGQAGDGTDAEETVGHHLERAHEYRRELGVLDDHTGRLAVRAGEKLAGAGLRGFALRFDAAGAETLLGRAGRLLPCEHPLQWEVSYRLAEAYETMGRHQEAEMVLSDLLARESELSDRRLVLELERVRVRFATGPDPTTLEEIVDLATTALSDCEASGDEAGMAQALFMLGEVLRRRGRIAEMEEMVRRELIHADRSDSGREQLGARRMLATALEIGPKPVLDCIEECEGLAWWRGGRNAAALPILAHLYAMSGEFDRAREMFVRAEVLFKERTRARRPLTLLRKRRAEVEILADDLDSAEEELRRALQLDLDMEIREEASEAAALLARVLFVKGQIDEAVEMADLSRTQAPSQSVVPQTLWRSTHAMTLAAQDQDEDAIRLAQTAVDMVPAAMLNLRADVQVDLAKTLRTLGLREAAQAALDEAVYLYDRKGNLAAASQARSSILSEANGTTGLPEKGAQVVQDGEGP